MGTKNTDNLQHDQPETNQAGGDARADNNKSVQSETTSDDTTIGQDAENVIDKMAEITDRMDSMLSDEPGATDHATDDATNEATDNVTNDDVDDDITDLLNDPTLVSKPVLDEDRAAIADAAVAPPVIDDLDAELAAMESETDTPEAAAGTDSAENTDSTDALAPATEQSLATAETQDAEIDLDADVEVSAEAEAELVMSSESADELAKAMQASEAAPDELDSLDSELAELGDALLDDSFGEQDEPEAAADAQPETQAHDTTDALPEDTTSNESATPSVEASKPEADAESEPKAETEPESKPKRKRKPAPKHKKLRFKELCVFACSASLAFAKGSLATLWPVLRRAVAYVRAHAPGWWQWTLGKCADISQLVTAKLDERWPVARKAIGAVAVATIVYATLVWSYVLFVRKPIAPVPALKPASLTVEEPNRLGT